MGVVATKAVVGVFDREGRFDDPQQVGESRLGGAIKQFRECYYERVIAIDLVAESATIFDEVPHPLHLLSLDASPPVFVHAAAAPDDSIRDLYEASPYFRWRGC